MNGKKISRRIVQNRYSAPLSELNYNSPSFTIEEESSTIIKYKKTKITYYSGYSDQPSTWLAPEVDSINIISISSNEKYLFSALKRAGFSSYLVDYFAIVEQTSSLLKDPVYEAEGLIKREVSVSEEAHEYSFHLNGGNSTFHRIHELDSKFWRNILEASKKSDLLSISAIHLAADCNRDLMQNVSASLQQGHYECKGLRPYGFYWLDNDKKSGRMGKRSLDFPSFKDKRFECETVYFGSSKTEPWSVVFYNKETEQRDRKSAVSNYLMRVELRINFTPRYGVSKVLAENLLTSYLIKNGSVYRTQVFLRLVTQIVRFTTHFHDQGESDVAPWWKYQFIMPLIHASMVKRQINSECPNECISESSLYLPLPEVTSKRGRPKKSTPSNPVITIIPEVKKKRGRPKKDLTL